MKSTFYELSATSIDGEERPFSRYRGKVVLAVNTASKCGFTPQYEGLQALHEKHSDRGLVVLGFPCDQFGHQEPGDEESIRSGCMLDFGVTFPMFAKLEVNGPDTHPVFAWLRQIFPGEGDKEIEWNFTKFLLDRDGAPVKRYAPGDTPESIEADIIKLL